MERLLQKASQIMSTMMRTASSFLPGNTPREKLFVHPNHPRQKRTQQLLTRNTSSSSVCASRLVRRCSHQQMRRNVQSVLTTSAENVQQKSLMHPSILEDNWRLTSQSNKPMINLWTLESGHETSLRHTIPKGRNCRQIAGS